MGAVIQSPQVVGEEEYLFLLSLTPPKSFYPQKGRRKVQSRICHVALEVCGEAALVPPTQKEYH